MRVRVSSSVSPHPDWHLGLKALDTTDRRLHLLLPAGLGDVAWAWSKLCNVARDRPVTVHLPYGEQHRAGQYLRLLGVECSYLEGLSTRWVWDQPSEPNLPDLGGVVPIQANRHLESGQHLSAWFPELPLRYPQVTLPPGCVDTAFAVSEPFVLVFTCHEQYMRGNLPLHSWARIAKRIENSLGRVRFVGAGADVPFIQSIRQLLGGPSEYDLLDLPLERVLAAARKATLYTGLAGGPTITGLLEGCPTYFAYPSHLGLMPGTWEPLGTDWSWSYVSQYESRVFDGALEELVSRCPPKYVHVH